MFMRRNFIVWLSSQLHNHCIEEANRFDPLETGGALMGYWHGAHVIVITAVVGPGPGALHERYSFEPDQEWQLAEIARQYQTSGRRETYLGDWHTHPCAKSGQLSRRDRRVLRRIINTPAARVQYPVMMLLHGTENEWQTIAWLAGLQPRRLISPKLLLSRAELRLY